MMDITESVARVKANIAAAAEKAGRRPEDIYLVAASKMNDSGRVREAIAAGIRICGENRVQEMLEKQAQGAYEGAELHFIGHLQKNKVKYIIDKVDLIHSVDSLSLIEEIDKRAASKGKIMNVLIEVNSGKEEAKGGIMPEDVCDFVEKARKIPSVCVKGLMTMGPKCENKEEYLKYFLITKQLFDKIFYEDKDAVLSMGMSDSYEYAVRAGATLVRVGSAIFGERKYL